MARSRMADHLRWLLVLTFSFSFAEASRAVLRYGFDVLALQRIYIRTDGPNAASVAVMQRLGARYVRTDPTGAFGSTIVYVMELRPSG